MQYPIFQFLFRNIVLSILIIIVLLVKRALGRHMTVLTQYSVSRLFLLMLAVPFLPASLIRFPLSLDWLRGLSQTSEGGYGASTIQATVNAAMDASWMQDLAVASDGIGSEISSVVLTAFWAAGVIAMILLTIRGNHRLRFVRKSMMPITNQTVLTLYRDAAKLAGYGRGMELWECDGLTTPITFGLLRPHIVIPGGLPLADDAVRCVFLHELLHRKHMDVIVNHMACLYRILYWFNPFVWIFLREMQTEREVACDASVLGLLEQDQYYDYGKTVLCFASDRIQPFTLAPEMGGPAQQIRKRIEEIASFRIAAPVKKIKSGLIFLIICLFVLASLPAFTVFAKDSLNYSLTTQSIVAENLSSYFNEYNGSFVLYHPATDIYTVYNERKGTTRIPPYSTYKIYDLLFALESGVITTEQSLRPWDGAGYPFAEWNADQDYRSGLKNSVNWYFETLDREMGAQKIQEYIERIGYGTQNISGGDLRVSPIEQVELLYGLYDHGFGFTEANVTAVKDAMILEQSEGGLLSGKTGSAQSNGKGTDGWFVGCVEKGGESWYFSVHISGENANGNAAAQIALNILNAKGIYQS